MDYSVTKKRASVSHLRFYRSVQNSLTSRAKWGYKTTLSADARTYCTWPSEAVTLNKKRKAVGGGGVFQCHLCKSLLLRSLVWHCGTGCARLDDDTILPSSRIHHSSSRWQELFVATQGTILSVLSGEFTDWLSLTSPPPRPSFLQLLQVFSSRPEIWYCFYSCEAIDWLLGSTQCESFGVILGCLVTAIQGHRSGRLRVGGGAAGIKGSWRVPGQSWPWRICSVLLV